jgi:hypothetical protein
MSTPFIRTALLLVLSLAAVSACAPIAASPATPGSATPGATDSAPTAAPVEIPAPGPVAEPLPAPLPEDALLEVTATATAANGAVLKLRAVVLRERLWSDPAGSPRAKATSTWCTDDALPMDLIKQQKWTFAEADYSATLADGSPSWPSKLAILLAPYNTDRGSRAHAGDVVQKEYTSGGPGDYEPFCVQRAFLPGPGAGALYLGATDSTGSKAYTDWSRSLYGFDFDLPTRKAGAGEVVVSDCVQTITPLGHSLGAPSAKWTLVTDGATCLVGVPQTQNDPHT